jgi:hypothetical protein
MKTAIEQMMEDLNNTFPRFFNVHSLEGRVFMGIATKYLIVEKEQIENAFEQGENNSVDYFNPENRIKESEQYYKETYGGNK